MPVLRAFTIFVKIGPNPWDPMGALATQGLDSFFLGKGHKKGKNN